MKNYRRELLTEADDSIGVITKLNFWEELFESLWLLLVEVAHND